MTTKTQERQVDGKFAGVVAQQPQLTQGEIRLNQALQDVQSYVYCGQAQAVAATLYAAATHVSEEFYHFGRAFFTSDTFEGGKTTFMLTVAHLSRNPEDTDGSSYALQSLLAEYHNAPEKGRPTLYRDEISDVFGKAGLSGNNNPLAGILRKGYKRDSVAKWSVNRVAEEYLIGSPFLVAGNGNALPGDIRSRCLVLKTSKGKPKKELETELAEALLRQDGIALGNAVEAHRTQFAEFELPDMEGMTARKAQVWKPLIAVAKIVGGERWYQMALQAFQDLNATGKPTEVLTSTQELLKIMAEFVDGLGRSGSQFVEGALLRDRLSLLPRFERQPPRAVSMYVAEALSPAESFLKRPHGNDNPVRGYNASDVIDAWNAVKPESFPEVGSLEAEDIFA